LRSSCMRAHQIGKGNEVTSVTSSRGLPEALYQACESVCPLHTSEGTRTWCLCWLLSTPLHTPLILWTHAHVEGAGMCMSIEDTYIHAHTQNRKYTNTHPPTYTYLPTHPPPLTLTTT